MSKSVILVLVCFLFSFSLFSQGKKARARNEARMIEGMKFLNENGKREGIITTLSGLQYEVLQEGEGQKPGLYDNVTTHYHGTLLDGTVFDSSVDRGAPATFPVNGVIKGWTEALQIMPIGSKWKLYIPSHLAYGAKGSDGKIKPYSTLIFEIELLNIR